MSIEGDLHLSVKYLKTCHFYAVNTDIYGQAVKVYLQVSQISH